VSRTQSLYARLEHLEAHFAARLLAEVEREAKRCSSMFLLRRMTPYFGGKIYRSQRVEDLEKQYAELLALEEKLHHPLARGPVAIVRSYERLVPHGEFPRPETRARFAKSQIITLKEYVRASPSRGLTSA